MRLLALLLLCFPGSAAVLVRQACGGLGGVDAAGGVWQADAAFAAKAQWDTAGVQEAPYNHLCFSSPPGVPLSRSFQLAPGTYSVTLYFVEPNKTGPGQRVFSVAINGATVLPNLDLFAVAGLLVPTSYNFPVVTATGSLTVTFTPASPTSGNALVSGIKIDGDVPWLPVQYKAGPGSALPKCPGGLAFYVETDTGRRLSCTKQNEDWLVWDVTQIGLDSARPACPGATFYEATDTKRLYRCNGVEWRQLSEVP